MCKPFEEQLLDYRKNFNQNSILSVRILEFQTLHQIHLAKSFEEL